MVNINTNNKQMKSKSLLKKNNKKTNAFLDSEVIFNPTDQLQRNGRFSSDARGFDGSEVFTSFHLGTVFFSHKVYIKREKIDKYRPCHSVSAIVYLRNQIAPPPPPPPHTHTHTHTPRIYLVGHYMQNLSFLS